MIYVGVDSECRVNMEELKAVNRDDTILITIMQVNNETGTIMPVDDLAE